MGYIEEARENHVKKKVEEGPCKKLSNPFDVCVVCEFGKQQRPTFSSDLLRNNLPSTLMCADLRCLCQITSISALRSKMKQKALKECDAYAKKYAECATGRTISVAWKCRQQAKELNGCLHQFTNDSVLEEMKKNYMQGQDKK